VIVPSSGIALPGDTFDKPFDTKTPDHPHRMAGRCRSNSASICASRVPRYAVRRCGYLRTSGLYLMRCG